MRVSGFYNSFQQTPSPTPTINVVFSHVGVVAELSEEESGISLITSLRRYLYMNTYHPRIHMLWLVF